MPNRDLRVGGVEPELITTVLRFGTICCAAVAEFQAHFLYLVGPARARAIVTDLMNDPM